MYTTQMDAARKGIITPQMKIGAEKERMDAEEIRSLVAKGQVIIPCNKNHKALHPSGVGARLTTKINVNLGVSRDWKDVDMEYEKVRSSGNGRRGDYGFKLLRGSQKLSPQADGRLPCHDRHRADL